MFAALFTLGLFVFAAGIVAVSVYFREQWTRESMGPLSGDAPSSQARSQANAEPITFANVQNNKDLMG